MQNRKITNLIFGGVVFWSALLLRLFHTWTLQTTEMYQFLLNDARYFDFIAKKIVSGSMQAEPLYITLSPVYLFFLSSLYSLFAPSPVTIQIAQAILGSCTCLLIFLTVKNIWSSSVALIAGLLASFCGIFIFYDAELLKPSLTNFFLVLFFYLISSFEQKRNILLLIFSAISFACALLLRMQILLFVPALSVWFFLEKSQPSIIKRILNAFVFLIFLIATCLAWKAWLDHTAPDQKSGFSQSGIHFYIGNTKQNTSGTYTKIEGIRNHAVGHSFDARKTAERKLKRKLTPEETNHYWIQKTLQEIQKNPTHWIYLEIKKLFLIFHHYEIPSLENFDYTRGKTQVLKLPLVTFGFIFPFACVGIFLSLKNKIKGTELPILFITSYITALLLTFVRADYRLPLHPVMIFFTAYGLKELFDLSIKKQYHQLTFPILLLCLSALLCHAPTFVPKKEFDQYTETVIKKNSEKRMTNKENLL